MTCTSIYRVLEFADSLRTKCLLSKSRFLQGREKPHVLRIFLLKPTFLSKQDFCA